MLFRSKYEIAPYLYYRWKDEAEEGLREIGADPEIAKVMADFGMSLTRLIRTIPTVACSTALTYSIFF